MLKGNYLLIIINLILIIGCSTSNKEKGADISLNGDWFITETSSKDSLPLKYSSVIRVPSLIDMATPKFKKLNYGEDSSRYFWYKKTIAIDHTNFDIVELEIKKARYSALVYINGSPVSLHNIAFSSARINIKDYLKDANEENEIVIRIGTKEDFPDTLICGDDFEKKTFFPGIYDDVSILLKNRPYIENVQIAPDINNDKVVALVELKQPNSNEPFKLKYSIQEKNTKKLLTKGTLNVKGASTTDIKVMLDISVSDYVLWSPENPFLYELCLSTPSDYSVTKFGMRSFAVDTLTKKMLLNNNPYFLRGTNVAMYRFFEDSVRGYLPWDEQWVRGLFSKFKSMNWNSLRFHVGPAPDFWYDIADEVGILIQDEYAIWYGKGGFKDNKPKVTTAHLVREYTNWMRERWNHPSIVIWDAQNETVADITGEALEIVREFDLSNRPWDNGYSAPTRTSDIIESHPYLFHNFHFKNSVKPKEGILKYLLGTVRLPYNDPNEQDPDPNGKYYNNAVVLNEYGWLWVNRDGSPTTLSEGVYKNLFDYIETPEERIELYSRLIAVLTEYWRAHQKVAGIQHFAGLTYTRPFEPRGQTSDCFKDIVNLEIHPDFIKYVKPAFSPIGLMIDVWDESYQTNQKLKVPIYIINDLVSDWSGKVKLSVFRNDMLVQEEIKNLDAKKYDVSNHEFYLTLPEKTGDYELRAYIQHKGEDVVSYRRISLR